MGDGVVVSGGLDEVVGAAGSDDIAPAELGGSDELLDAEVDMPALGVTAGVPKHRLGRAEAVIGVEPISGLDGILIEDHRIDEVSGGEMHVEIHRKAPVDCRGTENDISSGDDQRGCVVVACIPRIATLQEIVAALDREVVSVAAGPVVLGSAEIDLLDGDRAGEPDPDAGGKEVVRLVLPMTKAVDVADPTIDHMVDFDE